MRTPAVGSIEKRWSSGGATPDHTPAAASPRGQPNRVMGRQEGERGINTPHFEEKIGEQTPPKVSFSHSDQTFHYHVRSGRIVGWPRVL